MNRILFFLNCGCIFLLASFAYAQEQVKPATLKDSVVLAVKNHPKIKAMMHNRDAMRGNKAAALGRFFPSLDLRSSFGTLQQSDPLTRTSKKDDDFNTYIDTSLSLRLNLFAGFGDVNTYKGAKRRLSSAEYRLHDNVESIALDAIRAHYDVVRERRLLELARKNIEDHKILLGAIAERVQGGATDRADETQANSRLSRAETTLISYQGKLRNAEADYIWATGVAPRQLLQPVYHEDFLLGDLEVILEDCETNNPKILAAMEDVDAVASSHYRSDVKHSGEYVRDHRGALEASWNLFNGMTDVRVTQVAKAREEEGYALFEKTALDVNRDVVAAWFDYQTAVKEVENYKRTLDFSRETNEMYMVQFNVGQRSLLDMLDSLNEVFNNSVLLETARMNRSYSLYKLLALQGRLVRALEVSYQ